MATEADTQQPDGDPPEDDHRQWDRDLDAVKRHCAQLAEHFDSVQIFVTRHDPSRVDGTMSTSWGEGNSFANYGQVRQWLARYDARVRKNANGD